MLESNFYMADENVSRCSSKNVHYQSAYPIIEFLKSCYVTRTQFRNVTGFASTPKYLIR